ncbi:hypothetical protein Tco_1457573 [Tanacetum coccineum]
MHSITLKSRYRLLDRSPFSKIMKKYNKENTCDRGGYCKFTASNQLLRLIIMSSYTRDAMGSIEIMYETTERVAIQVFVHSGEIPAVIKLYRTFQMENKLEENDFSRTIFEAKYYAPEEFKALNTPPTNM